MAGVRTPGINSDPELERAVPGGTTAPPYAVRLAEKRSAAVPAELDGDRLLQLSRRVDWRFLLPNPHLGRVALLAGVPEDLTTSLACFADSTVAVRESLEGSAPEGSDEFDVVVASSPDASAAKRALGLLRPGGTLYLEASRSWNPGGARGTGCPRSAAEYMRLLENQGFVEIECHWHWPDFGRTTVIVPLDDETALEHAFARDLRGLLRWLVPLLRHTVGRPAWFRRVAPRFSLLARKPGLGEPA